MNIDLTTIINAIIGLLAALVTYRLIPWIKAKTTNEQQAYIRALVKAGVYAAEQIYNTEGMGRQKMEYVQAFLQQDGYMVKVTHSPIASKEASSFSGVRFSCSKAANSSAAQISA